MSVTRDILEGVAGMLSGIAPDITWASTNVSTGIVMKTMPDSPDRIVVLNQIPQTDDPVLPMGNIMIQLAGRGARNNPIDVDDILDVAFTVLHGTADLTFGTVHVSQMSRYSSIPMGQDDNDRQIRIDKYTLDCDYPGTAARPATGF